MARNDAIDAAEELDRLRSAELWAGAAFVVAAPEAIVSALGGVPLPSEVGLAIGCLLLAGYVVGTVALGPDLPRWSYRAWLFSKVAATALTGIAVGALAVAGPFGLVVAVPAVAGAVVSAIGTAFVGRGVLGGSILVVATFSFVGLECGRQHFQLSSDDDVVHAVGIAAFSIAAVSAALAVAAIAGARRAACEARITPGPRRRSGRRGGCVRGLTGAASR